MNWKDPDRTAPDHPAGEIVLSHVGGDDYLPTEWCTRDLCTWDCTWMDCTIVDCPGTWEPQCPILQ